jgi:hypothetical protein
VILLNHLLNQVRPRRRCPQHPAPHWSRSIGIGGRDPSECAGSTAKTFEAKHDIISKVTMKPADDVLLCPQQIEMWRMSDQPASLIRLEHGFDKPKKNRETRNSHHLSTM